MCFAPPFFIFKKMKKYFILIFIILSCIAFSNAETANMKNVPDSVFVNKGRTDFDSIFIAGSKIKNEIEKLFNINELLLHEHASWLSPQTSFEKYWEIYGSSWKAIDFKQDGELTYVFNGKSYLSDVKENLEFYKLEGDKYVKLWVEYGNLLAYKIHPLTKEIILYHHKYPCCKSASHNITTLRLIDNKIHSKFRFFVGRDVGDMKGPFFPEQVSFPSSYKKMKERTMVRWSPEVIEKDAFKGVAHTNEMIHYEEGAIYQVLYSKNDWQFVILYSGIAEEQSNVLNYTNFKYRPIYGWIAS